MAPIKLSKEIVKSLLDSIDTVLFDCDGVLWAGNKLLHRSAETVNKLKADGKRVFYVTNNSTKTRSQYLSKLTSLGFNAEEREIGTSGYLVASYLKSIGFDKNVYLIGSPGFSAELADHGIKTTKPGPDVMPCEMAQYVKQELQGEENVGAVVVGFDEHISYPKIMKAANYLADPNCLFLASNADETFPMDIPLVVPGTGVMVRAVETATQRKAKVFGKPSTAMFEAISAKCNVAPGRTLMVGDRCNTDINFGKNCLMKTLLVLSGVTTQETLDSYVEGCATDLIPDYYTDTLGDILDLLEN